MKLIFAGTPDFAAVVLLALLDAGHDIVLVLTQPDRPAGRGQKIQESAVKQLARRYNLPISQPENLLSRTPVGQAAQQQIIAAGADAMIVAAYGLILPQVVLDIPRYGCLNIHASILPRWRGAAPIQRAILAGDTQTGITIMQMAAGLDTGDILYIAPCDISATITSDGLHDTLAQLGGSAIVHVLGQLAILQQHALVQDEAQAVYAQKLTKAEAQINWQLAAFIIERSIRAYHPRPVAYTNDGTQVIRVWQAQLCPSPSAQSMPGEILTIDAEGVIVACGDGQALQLLQLQWPSTKVMNAGQIMQMQRLRVGQFLQMKP